MLETSLARLGWVLPGSVSFSVTSAGSEEGALIPGASPVLELEPTVESCVVLLQRTGGSLFIGQHGLVKLKD